jgi:PTS system cellobiose-specific IIB component
MTVRIILACAVGFSSSMLVERMKAYANEEQLDVFVDAVSEEGINKIIDQVDILLLGPQVNHMEEILKEKYKDRPVKISVIDSMAYGLMDGKKVLKNALK